MREAVSGCLSGEAVVEINMELEAVRKSAGKIQRDNKTEKQSTWRFSCKERLKDCISENEFVLATF